MKLRDFVSEAPITDIHVHGDTDTPGTFRTDDLKKVTDPAWRERVIKLFSKAPVDIELHIVNGGPDGKVKMSGKTWIDKLDTSKVKRYVGIQSEQWAETILGHPVDASGKIVCLLLQNEGSNRVGLTPWIVGHRLSHCFFENNDREINNANLMVATRVGNLCSGFFYEMAKFLDKNQPGWEGGKRLIGEELAAHLIRRISRFRSARTMNLTNTGEYVGELFTQFLIHGKVTFLADWIGGEPMQPLDHSPLEALVLDACEKLGKDVVACFRDERVLRAVYSAMAGNPLRPKTRAALRDVARQMFDEDRDGRYPAEGWTEAQRMHQRLDRLASEINLAFTRLLTMNVGKVVVL